MKHCIFFLLFLVSFLGYGYSGTPIRSFDKKRADSIFTSSMDLTYFNLKEIEKSIEVLKRIKSTNNDPYFNLIYSGLLFIKNSNSMIFNKEMDELFEFVLLNLDQYKFSHKLRLNNAISYYLFQTHQYIQFLKFHENVYKKNILECRDSTFLICSLFGVSWNFDKDLDSHKRLSQYYLNLALELYEDYNRRAQNDTIDAIFYRNAVRNIQEELPTIQIVKFKKAYEASRKSGNLMGASYQAYEIGRLYFGLDNFESAKFFFKLAIEDASDYPKWKGYYMSEVGFILEIEGDFEKAIVYFKDAYNLYVEGENTKDNHMKSNPDKYIFVLDHLTNCFIKINRSIDAFKYFYLAQELRKNEHIANFKDFDYLFKDFNKINDSTIKENQSILDSFFHAHNIYTEYPDFTPELNYGDTNLLLSYQENEIFKSQENSVVFSTNEKEYRKKIYYILIGFLLTIFGLAGFYIRYLKAKKKSVSLKDEIEIMNKKHLDSLGKLEELKVKMKSRLVKNNETIEE